MTSKPSFEISNILKKDTFLASSKVFEKLANAITSGML
jgi:hypothetical protein